MKQDELDLRQALDYIDPRELSYSEWVGVGMGLKEAGYPVGLWEDWSRRDGGRYRTGECARKWDSFRGTDTPITAGTIVQMAQRGGWQPNGGDCELGWDDEIGGNEPYRVIDPHWVEAQEIAEPAEWHPAQQLITYLETLFDSEEHVGYVTRSFSNEDGKAMPTKGDWARTAGQLVQALSACGDDIGSVLGDYDPAVGAWIRFNPLDGKGIRNENVTAFRYALVECDGMDIDRQNALIRELELPVACLVHSGGKSVHAIVHIDAPDYPEYRKRVEYLYTVCRKNGLELDQQNRNPSRLSRMPGVLRKGHKQFLIDTNIGKSDFAEWREFIESATDDLPDPESMSAVWDEMPPLAPALIGGVLRQGHKMLLAGPSKAGKSFALIELTIAIAEGKSWLGFDCAQGRVLYVNLELDRASCLHRFRDVYSCLGWKPEHLGNIDIWNLRGKSVPMDRLTPKLIRRAVKKDYIAVIIDPFTRSSPATRTPPTRWRTSATSLTRCAPNSAARPSTVTTIPRVRRAASARWTARAAPACSPATRMRCSTSSNWRYRTIYAPRWRTTPSAVCAARRSRQQERATRYRRTTCAASVPPWMPAGGCSPAWTTITCSTALPTPGKRCRHGRRGASRARCASSRSSRRSTCGLSFRCTGRMATALCRTSIRTRPLRHGSAAQRPARARQSRRSRARRKRSIRRTMPCAWAGMHRPCRT